MNISTRSAKINTHCQTQLAAALELSQKSVTQPRIVRNATKADTKTMRP